MCQINQTMISKGLGEDWKHFSLVPNTFENTCSTEPPSQLDKLELHDIHFKGKYSAEVLELTLWYLGEELPCPTGRGWGNSATPPASKDIESQSILVLLVISLKSWYKWSLFHTCVFQFNCSKIKRLYLYNYIKKKYSFEITVWCLYRLLIVILFCPMSLYM